jgi:chromosome segregation ATPase
MTKSSSSSVLSSSFSDHHGPADERDFGSWKQLVLQLQSQVQTLQQSLMDKDRMIIAMQKEIRELSDQQHRLEQRMDRQKRKSVGISSVESDR